MTRTPGFTLLELLVVLAVLAILFALGAGSMLGWLQSLRAREAAANIVAMIGDAKIMARSDNRDLSFVLDPSNRTIGLQRGGTTLRTTKLDADTSAIQVRAPATGTISTSNSLNVMAPYGTFSTSPAAIQVTSGGKSVWVYIIGVTGKLVVR